MLDMATGHLWFCYHSVSDINSQGSPQMLMDKLIISKDNNFVHYRVITGAVIP
jgi:tellurite resistance-related uncharacterized protein